MRRVKLSRLELQSRINGWFRRHKDADVSISQVRNQDGETLDRSSAVRELERTFSPYVIQIHDPSSRDYLFTISIWERI